MFPWAEVSGEAGPVSEQGKLRPGWEVTAWITQNRTVRLFDPIAVHETEMRSRAGEGGITDKATVNRCGLQTRHYCPNTIEKLLW